jgi:hypothetical protein
MGFFRSPPESKSGVDAGLRMTCMSTPPEANTGAYAKLTGTEEVFGAGTNGG